MGYADFCCLIQNGAFVTLVLSGVTGLIFVKFAPDVATILPLNIFESELAYSYLFPNANLPNEGHFANFAQIGCHGNVPSVIEKRGQFDHLQTNTYHLVKKCEN